jgi:tRNA(Ile)-lysidine synthase
MERLRAAQCLVAGMVDDLQKKACSQKEDMLYIKISDLPTEQRGFWLFELLHERGFSGATVSDVVAALDGESGKIIYSPTHQLLQDREMLIVAPKKREKLEMDKLSAEVCRLSAVGHPIEIEEAGLDGQTVKVGSVELSFEIIDATNVPLNQGSSVALLDYDALQFPLQLRCWQTGDRFVPLGMKGEKKLSDFFTDSKLNLFEKQEQLLLCSANGDVAWVAGLRMDNRCRVTKNTRQILKAVVRKF